MSPSEYDQLPKDLDGVVRPEDYAKSELEEILFLCMKPAQSVIKIRTPESEVKQMLGQRRLWRCFETMEY